VRPWWSVIDAATAHSGLVTNELVLASHGLAGTSLALPATPTARER
jgi:hypothetical protein